MDILSVTIFSMNLAQGELSGEEFTKMIDSANMHKWSTAAGDLQVLSRTCGKLQSYQYSCPFNFPFLVANCSHYYGMWEIDNNVRTVCKFNAVF